MPGQSLRETIEAAVAAAENTEEPAGQAGPEAGAETPPPAETGAQAAAGETGAEAAAETGAQGAEGGQPRDPSGKFAKSEKTEDTQRPEAAQPAEATPPDEETSRPPPGLPAPLRAEWTALDPKWRKAFVDQEKSFQIVRNEWGPKAEQLNRLQEVVAPHRQRLALSGVDEVTWIRNLAAAEQALIDNPAAGIAYLARTYGAQPQAIIAHLTGQAAPMSPATDPRLAPILTELETLKQSVTQQQRSAEEAQKAEIRAHIEAFANDPRHLYWPEVKEDVAALLAQNRASGLEDAYEKACWANPEIRGLMLQQQQADQAKQAQQTQARAKATAAAQAAGSVTGAPGPGGSAAGGPDPNNLRGLIAAAMEEAAGRV